MQPGDTVQAIGQIASFKKTVYAEAGQLLTITSIDFLPVLMVTRKAAKKVDMFPVRVELVTTEINERLVPVPVTKKIEKEPVKKKRYAKRF